MNSMSFEGEILGNLSVFVLVCVFFKSNQPERKPTNASEGAVWHLDSNSKEHLMIELSLAHR